MKAFFRNSLKKNLTTAPKFYLSLYVCNIFYFFTGTYESGNKQQCLRKQTPGLDPGRHPDPIRILVHAPDHKVPLGPDPGSADTGKHLLCQFQYNHL